MTNISPSRDVAVGIDHRQAEGLGVAAGELRNGARDLAPVRPLRHLGGDFGYGVVKRGHGACSSNSGFGVCG
jgi:hypothetical protein